MISVGDMATVEGERGDRFTVAPHTARMTGAFWFVIRGEHGGSVRVNGVEYWDDGDWAQEIADELNAGTLDPDED